MRQALQSVQLIDALDLCVSHRMNRIAIRVDECPRQVNEQRDEEREKFM